MQTKIGDRVRAWKYVYDTAYSIEGVVIETQMDLGEQVAKIRADNGDTDYYRVENGLTDKFEILQSAKPEPEKLPSWAVGWCHYCGMPAKSFDFFDEPACYGCGGN